MIKRQEHLSGFFPIHVQIEVTWKCNWRCVHCYQDNHNIQALDTVTLERLFKELAANGTLHIIITGGEPLVRKDIFELLETIKHLGIATTLYSNGHKIDKPTADRLSSLIAVAELSLLAGTAEIHDSLSAIKGSFDKTVAAIKNLTENGIKVILKTPVLKPAYHTLKTLENMANDLNIEWYPDTEISRSYAGADYALQYHLSFNEIQKFFEQFPRFNPSFGFNTDPGVKKGLCLAGRQYCFIDAMGNVYPCLNFKSACDVLEKAGKNPVAKLGNILYEPFAEIWKPKGVLEEIRNATIDSFKVCRTCKSGNGCKPCMALNYEENDVLFRPAKTVCNFTKAGRLLLDPAFQPASEQVMA